MRLRKYTGKREIFQEYKSVLHFISPHNHTPDLRHLIKGRSQEKREIFQEEYKTELHFILPHNLTPDLRHLICECNAEEDKSNE